MLTYPLSETLQPGAVRAIRSAVLRIRLNLPFVLDHVNVWALENGDGWTIVDTGMRTPAVAWESPCSCARGTRPVRRMVCTYFSIVITPAWPVG